MNLFSETSSPVADVTESPPKWHHGWRLARGGGFAIIYILSVLVSVGLTDLTSIYASFWLPSGLLLGTLLCTPRREWWVILLGMLVGDLACFNTGEAWPLKDWLLALLGNAGSGVFGAWLVQRLAGRRPTLARVRDLFFLVGVGGGVGLAPAALIGPWTTNPPMDGADFWRIWSGWYFSNLLGVILVAPLIIAWHRQGLDLFRWSWSPRIAEAVLLGLLLFSCIAVVIIYNPLPGVGLRFVVFPFVVWAAIRFGPRGVTTVSFAVALLLGWFAVTDYGHGISGFLTPTERKIQLQMALSFIGFFGLIPAIVIEAHKLTLDALRGQRKFQQTIFDSAPECLKVYGLDGEIVAINRAGFEIMEVDTLAEAKAFGLINFVEPAYREQVRQRVMRTVGEGETLLYQIRSRRGRLRWMEMKPVFLRDVHGTVTGLMTVSRDITASKETEEALRIARFTVDRATVPMLWARPDAAYVDANQAACELVGRTLEELKQLRVPDIDVDFNDRDWPVRWAELRERQSLVYPSQLRRPDGALIDVIVSAHFLRIGTREMSCAFVQDVTVQKKSEEIRRKKEEELKLVFSAVGEGIVLHDHNLAIIRSNTAAERILGLSAEQLNGLNNRDSRWQAVCENGEIFPGYDHPAAVVLRTARGVRDVIMGIRKPDGELTWLSVNAEPLCDAHGAVTMVVTSFLDITASRVLQEQMRQAQKMEIVGQLAGGVAHDFNNILTAMMLNLEVVEMCAPPPPEHKQPLDEMRLMIQRAAKLTAQLLLFARRSVMKLEQADLSGVTANVIAMIRRVLGEQVLVNLRCSPDPLPINADTGMIDQVVMNLCVNARDAMGAGGTLTIETSQVEFKPARDRLPTRVGSFACLTVADTGTGMPPEVLAHMFEPFFTTKEVGKGTGLGLATVHGIVQEHQGWIEVESVVNAGSTFRVYLPMAPSLAATPALALPPAARKEISGGAETILLVEDEDPVRQVSAMMLRRMGYQVLEAASGPEALALWQKHQAQIQLLVSDMVMPRGMSGLQLSEQLRQEKPSLHVIIMSGYTHEIFKNASPDNPRFSYLAKPFEFSAFAELVSQHLRSDAG